MPVVEEGVDELEAGVVAAGDEPLAAYFEAGKLAPKVTREVAVLVGLVLVPEVYVLL